MLGPGERLKQARLERGISLEEAEKATKIRRAYLAALEEEDFDRLPSAIYAKGFLQVYARYLGLNIEEILGLFPMLEAPTKMRPLPKLPKSPPRIAAWVVFSIILIAIAAGGYYLYREQQVKYLEQAEAHFQIPTATPTPTELAKSKVFPSPVSLTPEGSSSTPVSPTSKVSPSPAAPTATKAGVASSPTLTVIPTSTSISAKVQVPNLISRRYDEAESLSANGGFKLTRQDEWNANIPAGIVFAQNPNPGAQISLGQAVNVIVSKGVQQALIVPNVIGKPEKEAKQMIASVGLHVRDIAYHGHDTTPKERLEYVPVGCVLSITPAAGTELPPGSAVDMSVRKD